MQAELGLNSMLSYRMNLEFAGVIAGLNLYGRATDAFDEHDLAEGLLLTTHAAQAVSAAHLRDRAENLERALSSNRDIGTAVGVLMGQHKLTRDQAFDLLRIASQNTNRKLRDVALDVIDTGDVDVTPHQATLGRSLVALDADERQFARADQVPGHLAQLDVFGLRHAPEVAERRLRRQPEALHQDSNRLADLLAGEHGDLQLIALRAKANVAAE